MKKKISYKIVSLAFSILVICFAIGFYVYGVWTEPTVGPPGGNVYAPINVSGETQIKQGSLGINNLFRAYYKAIVGTAAVEPIDPGEYELWVEGDLRVTGGFDIGPLSMKYDPVADKLTVDAEIETGVLTATTICFTGDICRTTWPTGVGTGCEDVIKTISADSGSKIASGCSDALTIAGGTGISTAISGSTLTITSTGTITEQDTLDTVSDRGRSTDQSIITGGLELDGLGSEGNISEANIISGYSDLHLRATAGGTHAAIYLDDDSEELEFYTNNIQRVTINSFGDVGIGDTSPEYKLDVAGDVGLNQHLYHNDDTDTYLNFESDRLRAYIGSEYLLDLYEGTQDYVKLGDGGDVDIDLNDDLFIRGSDSRVGIGTESPMQKLHVVGNVRITGLISCNTIDTNASGDLVCGTDASGGGITSLNQGTGMTFSSNPITTTGTISLNTAGISTCTNATTDKIYWDSVNGRLACGTDATGGVPDTVTTSCVGYCTATCPLNYSPLEPPTYTSTYCVYSTSATGWTQSNKFNPCGISPTYCCTSTLTGTCFYNP